MEALDKVGEGLTGPHEAISSKNCASQKLAGYKELK